MRKIINTKRSEVHKAYNQAKREYREWEDRIIRYKQGIYGITPKFLQYFRFQLKEKVKKIKRLKREMSQYNIL